MKRIVIIVFLSFLLAGVFTVGCDEEEKITITTEQLKGGIAALGDMDTYRFDITSDTEQDYDEASNPHTMIFGVMDNINRKMHYMTSNEYEGEDGTYSMEYERYLINDVMYSRVAYSGEIGHWMKIPMVLEDWEEDMVVAQLELLEDAEIEIIGSAGIYGVECWAIKLLPGLEKYLEIIGEETTKVKPEELSEYISMKQWFAKDTCFLMKAEMEWTIVDYDSPSTTRMEIMSSHYNEPVSIELPAEAEEAEWVE